jgi:hypothetical protein
LQWSGNLEDVIRLTKYVKAFSITHNNCKTRME